MPEKVLNVDIAVIGAGSGGLMSAITLAKAGYKVLLIEKHLIGGDCTNYGCIPSKTLLYESKKVAEFGYNLATSKGLDDKIKSNLTKEKSIQALAKVRQVVSHFQDLESPQQIEAKGLLIGMGEAIFENKNRLRVKLNKLDESSTEVIENAVENKLLVEFKKVIIATGSRPNIPNLDGLSNVEYLTNHSVFDLQKPPQSMLILGTGPIAIEMAQAFNYLGTKVTVLARKLPILKKSDTELTTKLFEILKCEGVEFTEGNIKKIRKDKVKGVSLETTSNQILNAETLFLALGRKPNIEIGLEMAGIAVSDSGIKVNKSGKTSNKSIYAIGDCVANVPNFTHVAGFMGKQVATNLILQKHLKLPINFFKALDKLVPAVIFSSPELAQAGLTENEARKIYGNKVEVFNLDFEDVDRAITHNNEKGLIKLITVGFFNRIVGVHILANRAGEMLPELQILVQEKKTIFALDKIIRAYPTYTASLGYTMVKNWLNTKLNR